MVRNCLYKDKHTNTIKEPFVLSYVIFIYEYESLTYKLASLKSFKPLILASTHIWIYSYILLYFAGFSVSMYVYFA